MRRKRKNIQTLSPPINYWFSMSLFLFLILIVLTFLLIKERLFLQEMKVFFEKYSIYLNKFSNFNAQVLSSHLLKPTDPSSSTNFIYLQPERFTFQVSR